METPRYHPGGYITPGNTQVQLEDGERLIDRHGFVRGITRDGCIYWFGRDEQVAAIAFYVLTSRLWEDVPQVDHHDGASARSGSYSSRKQRYGRDS